MATSEKERTMVLELILTGTLVFGVRTVKKRFFPSEKERKNQQNSNAGNIIQQQSKKELIPIKNGQRANNMLNREIVFSSISLGFALGGLFFPPLALLSIPGLIYTGRPLFKRAFNLLKSEKRVGVATIVSIIILGCVALGYLIIGNFAILMFLLSEKLLNKVTQDTKAKLIDIFKLTPNQVWTLIDEVEMAVHIDKVKPGDFIVVNAGGIIPVDGVIVEGIASIDQHVFTGEGIPVEKDQGQEVFASTVVLSGKVVIEVKHAGEETTLAKIGQILNESIEFKSTVELRAHELADKTVVPAFILGGLTWPFLGVQSALAVINSHFKYKMNFIAPISIINFFKIASENGIIIKDGRSFELLNKVDTIVFDKTGTLTEEQPSVGAIHTFSKYNEKEVLRFAAAAEYRQTHPIARAILKAAETQELDIPSIDDVNYQVGYGLSVTIEDQLIQAGSLRFMEMLEIEISPDIQKIQDDCFIKGHSLLMIACNNELIAAMELIPTIRPGTKALIHNLMQRPQMTASYIISGDNETPTKLLAEELGIDHYFAETLPIDKAKLLEQLRDEGRFICYIGDGINDSIALKQAHVSVSLSGASMVAIDTAQVILMEQGLNRLELLFDLAKDFEKNMNTIFTAVTIPALISIGGVFFLHLGLGSTIILNQIGLGGGIISATMPLLKKKKK